MAMLDCQVTLALGDIMVLKGVMLDLRVYLVSV